MQESEKAAASAYATTVQGLDKGGIHEATVWERLG
jgi:hypothetical protein